MTLKVYSNRSFCTCRLDVVVISIRSDVTPKALNGGIQESGGFPSKLETRHLMCNGC